MIKKFQKKNKTINVLLSFEKWQMNLFYPGNPISLPLLELIPNVIKKLFYSFTICSRDNGTSSNQINGDMHFFFTYQSLSNCKVWINIWLSVATEFLFLHINDLNCLLLFFFSIRTNMFCIIGKKEDIKAVMEIAIAFPLFSVIKLF